MSWAQRTGVAFSQSPQPAFGTFITTYSVTLNNHTVAAISLVMAIAVSLPIFRSDCLAWWRFAVAGLSFGFLAANELPALSLLALAGLGLAWKSPLKTLAAFALPILLVAGTAFGTNLLAHGDWRTPYAHRSDGPVITTISDDLAVPLNEGVSPAELIEKLKDHQIQLTHDAQIQQRTRGDRWIMQTSRGPELVLVRTPEGAPKAEIQVRRHDNWYDYQVRIG